MKILMRMGMSPLDNCSLYEVVSRDTIGTNAGNMLFPYSVMNTVYRNGMTIHPYINAKEMDAEKINETYDMFLIPLANAFRKDFIGQLRNLTRLIGKLKIPCIVIGVGWQADYEPNFHIEHEYDKDVLEFCKAVLEKSHTLGVRGELTATYLEKIGIPSDKIRVIGCPSMYLYGEFLPLKKPVVLTEETKISLSYAGRNEEYYKFLERVKEQYPNYVYIPQKIYELRMLYAGDPVPEENVLNKYYIGTPDSRSFINGKMRMFINVPSWINFLAKMDMGVGCCIHGSIASVLAGNPTLVFAFDSRVRELAEFHKIPLGKMSDISEKTQLKEIVENTDFSTVLDGHKERYQNYLDFLKENGIPYKKIRYGTITDFEIKMNQMILNCPQGVVPYCMLSFEDQKRQLEKYIQLCDGKIKWCHNAKLQGQEEKRINRILQHWQHSKTMVLNNIQKLR